MRFRNFNWQIVAGFLLTIAASLSFPLLFVRIPATRDFPWANLLLFALSLVFLFLGVRRAFGPEGRRIGKVIASLLAVLGVFALAFFLFAAFILSRWLPPSTGAPQVGQTAPEFSLVDSNGKGLTLSQLLAEPLDGKAPKGVLLVFYRGYW